MLTDKAVRAAHVRGKAYKLADKVENPAVDMKDAPKPLPPSKRYTALFAGAATRALMGDVDWAGASPVNRFR